MSTPSCAPRPVPTSSAVGVASPSAQGQAMISTATAAANARPVSPAPTQKPNPAVAGAALAAITEHVEIRAGSVVMPLQSPLRVAEEWAVVDRLSKGRVGISFASGWHADDFVLAPESYARRKDVMIAGIETVRRLWRGRPFRSPTASAGRCRCGSIPGRSRASFRSGSRRPATRRPSGSPGT